MTWTDIAYIGGDLFLTLDEVTYNESTFQYRYIELLEYSLLTVS